MRYTFTTTEKCPKCNSEIIMFGYCCTTKHHLICTKCKYKKEIDYHKFEKKAKKKGEYVVELSVLLKETNEESTYHKWLKQYGAEIQSSEIGFLGTQQVFEKPIKI